ncbi:hypothetical protein [Flavobacterium sp.]|jgi:hypothetical protein|uniref:hypothetical protein n=1 Tax=Flavobacterium sp. TaxID=239 RepID=UPI0022C7B5B1|nr:hypothetical protein [Flavobacterium sp.]MCZ8144883.1 hypothetical protein [Flavobacterium sp.]
MNWRLHDIVSLNEKGLKATVQAGNPDLKAKVKTKSGESSTKDELELILMALEKSKAIPKYHKEFQFSDRKFRFDYAFPEFKLAIEYEGLVSEKSGHTTLKGYTKDCSKYNLATLMGWKILRYTALNYRDIAQDIELFFRKL